MKIVKSNAPPASIIESYQRKAGLRDILLAEGAQLVIPAPLRDESTRVPVSA